jgi:membrane protein DedA with SNARE-associated domain
MAGPLAGILRMRWKDFLLFNFLGAVAWVSTIATLGFLFGRFASIYEVFEKADLTLTLAAGGISLYWWHRYRKRFSGEEETREKQ